MSAADKDSKMGELVEERLEAMAALKRLLDR
jgi:hypothetical protein